VDENKAEQIIEVIWDRWEQYLDDWDLEGRLANDEARVQAIEALRESKIR
jgi:hypothetical protein